MSHWTVTPDSRHGLLAIHTVGLDYSTYWLTLDEAQALAEQLLEAIETLEAAPRVKAETEG